MLGFVSLVCALALAAPVRADPPPREPTWRPLNGPPGTITHLTLDTRQPDRLWAVAAAQTVRAADHSQRLSGGQFRRAQAIYYSADGGKTWRPAGNGLPYSDITALAYDSFSAQLYAGLVGGGEGFTCPQGLFRSSDDGAIWQKVELAPPYRQLKVLAIRRSADGATLYVGAVETTKYPRSFVYRSDDNGATWQEIQALEYEQSPGSILTDFMLDPQDSQRLYIPTYGGLFFSDDGGHSWREATLPACSPGPKLLAAEPDGILAARLYLSCPEESDGLASTRVLRSDNGGVTWREIGHQPVPGGARALTLLPGEPPVLLLATDRALFRSLDGGDHWWPLDDAREVAGAMALLARPDRAETLFAATGHGFYISRDGGEHWEARSVGLPPNGRLRVLASSPRQPGVVYGGLQWGSSGFGQWLVSVLRSDDDGQSWRTLVTGPWGEVRALAVHPQRPDHLFMATSVGLVRSRDGGDTWAEVSLDNHSVQAVAFDPTHPDTLYAGAYGSGVYRSTDGGRTWTARGLEFLNVSGLVVAPGGEVYAAASSYFEGRGGLYGSTDGGQTWERLTTAERGLETTSICCVQLDADDPQRLYVAAADAGVYRSTDGGGAWQSASAGLPSSSDILSLLQTEGGTLWASRDGGGVYRSTNGGKLWLNVGAGLGENLALALAADPREPSGLLAATDTAGLWVLGRDDDDDDDDGAGPSAPPEAVDARIEILWPHGGAAVEEAEQANIGLRLFWPSSLAPPPCDWTPRVEVWQAVNTEPAQQLQFAEQRSVESRPFPLWDLNDVDVSAARDPLTKLYFMVRVHGVKTATSVWAHGADPRTYFPHQDTPTGIATTEPRALQARIQIVWPHDGLGREQPVAQADWANVTVAFFDQGTGRSVPVKWEPEGLTLYGAWNQSIGRPLATEAEKRLVRRGAISFPVWDFNNIDVRAALNPVNKLYLWVEVDGVTTYPTIWAHGADARTHFPVEDEPIVGCGVTPPLPLFSLPAEGTGGGVAYVGDAADILLEALAEVAPDITDASSGAGRVEGEPAEALRAIFAPASRSLILQRQAADGQEYIFVADGVGPVAMAALGGRVYLFWPSDGKLWQQWWASDSEVCEVLCAAPQAVRAVRGEKGLELGIASEQLGNRSRAHYHLLRLYSGEESGNATVAGHWEPVWSWRDAPAGSWSGLEGQVAFVGEGLERLRLTGPLPDDFEGAPRVFAEIGVYTKQRVSSIWERQGDTYVRGTAILQPTPLTALSHFIVALREGDLDAAAEWVSDQSLVEEALGHGWSLPRPEGDRLVATGGYLEAEGEPIEFFSNDDRTFHFRVHFEQDATNWRILGIESLPPWE